MKKIQYNLMNGPFCVTTCPNGCCSMSGNPILVGSGNCLGCKWHKGINYETQTVFCSYAEEREAASRNPKGRDSSNAKSVRLYENNVFVGEFGTFSECAAYIGCSRSTIYRCIMHDRNFHGYTFEEGGIQ